MKKGTKQDCPKLKIAQNTMCHWNGSWKLSKQTAVPKTTPSIFRGHPSHLLPETDVAWDLAHVSQKTTFQGSKLGTLFTFEQGVTSHNCFLLLSCLFIFAALLAMANS